MEPGFFRRDTTLRPFFPNFQPNTNIPIFRNLVTGKPPKDVGHVKISVKTYWNITRQNPFELNGKSRNLSQTWIDPMSWHGKVSLWTTVYKRTRWFRRAGSQTADSVTGEFFFRDPNKDGPAKLFTTDRKGWLSDAEGLGFGLKVLICKSTNNNATEKDKIHATQSGPIPEHRAASFPRSRRHYR